MAPICSGHAEPACPGYPGAGAGGGLLARRYRSWGVREGGLLSRHWLEGGRGVEGGDLAAMALAHGEKGVTALK